MKKPTLLIHSLSSTIFCSILLLILCNFSPTPARADLYTGSFNFASRVTNGKWKTKLKTGQILLTESPKQLNFLILTLYPEFSPLFHAGITEVQNGEIFVYEANGDTDTLSLIRGLTIGGTAPSDFISGTIKRVPLDEFITESRTINIYEPPRSINTEKLITFAQSHAQAKTPFDPYFNLSDTSAFYCSEFVYQAYKYSGYNHNLTVRMRHNPSLRKILDWMRVPGNTLMPAYKLVSPSSWVGTVSYDFSPLGLKVDRAIKLELYQRFSANQKVGNLLNFGGNDDFVDAVKRFQRLAFKLFENQNNDVPASTVVSKVREAADNVLGTIPDHYRSPYSHCAIDIKKCAK